MNNKVFIGVGHGGADPGAVKYGRNEKDLNLQIALECKVQLERHGVKVGISRTKDENDVLAEEIRECNAFAPELAVDIHNNAGGGDGVEIYHEVKGSKSKELAQHIIGEIVKLGQNTRGATGLKTKTQLDGRDWFGFIREVKAPSILIECAFIDNLEDIKIIDTLPEQRAMGVAIAKGILKMLGIKWVELASKPAPTPVQQWKVESYPYNVKAEAERIRDVLRNEYNKQTFVVPYVK